MADFKKPADSAAVSPSIINKDERNTAVFPNCNSLMNSDSHRIDKSFLINGTKDKTKNQFNEVAIGENMDNKTSG